MSSINALHHIALTVTDVDTSAAWYTDVLGLEELMRGDDETVSYRVLGREGVIVGVREYKNHAGDRFSEFRTGLDHVAFAVPDRASLEEWEGRLAAAGVTYTPAVDTSIGSVVVFRDPDGIQLEMWLPVAVPQAGARSASG